MVFFIWDIVEVPSLGGMEGHVSCIITRLERIVCNQTLLDDFPYVLIKPFRFLNLWTKHEAFNDMVKEYWTNKESLHKAQIDFVKYIRLEKEYWRQNARIKWFKD
ncbi:hypothetical protein H5410_040850 [Solanum commersonii]|uniref:Uncharacterized protein n=1 Tax=Solanum commersonii TaxID=4109 RepID=A0A9J5XT48_SOLCO|nr:hypothetical protein H5410_040850 [Solanum commersonii]